MEPRRLPHQALYARLQDMRPAARPELRWVDNIAADVGKPGLTIVEPTRKARVLKVNFSNFHISETTQ